MKLSVRRAEEKDTPRIMNLLRQVNNVHSQGRPDIFIPDGTKYTPGQLKILMSDDSRPIFVAVDEHDEVCGYGFCVMIVTEETSNLRARRELYIDDLCVDETLRRQGVGQVLYDYILNYAREEGCYHLTLNVWQCNPSAMRFYEKQGMQMLKKEMEVIL